MSSIGYSETVAVITSNCLQWIRQIQQDKDKDVLCPGEFDESNKI
jgi:hypothetical protein